MVLCELQEHLFDILCKIDEICHLENIPYMLAGGTMLGAVRDQGFIPWDDDIDIFVWRKDYSVLREALLKHLPPYYQLTEPDSFLPFFYDFICRVQDVRYTFRTPNEEDIFYKNKQNYISVDLFLLDNGANTLAGLNVRAFCHRFIYCLAMGHRFRIDWRKYPIFQRLFLCPLIKIGTLIPMKNLLECQKKICNFHHDKPGKYCMVTNDLPQNLSLPYLRIWFTDTVMMKFWNRYFPVQAGYDEKLTLQYGDYMHPPKDRNLYVQHSDCIYHEVQK